jgi:hypothetical protein
VIRLARCPEDHRYVIPTPRQPLRDAGSRGYYFNSDALVAVPQEVVPGNARNEEPKERPRPAKPNEHRDEGHELHRDSGRFGAWPSVGDRSSRSAIGRCACLAVEARRSAVACRSSDKPTAHSLSERPNVSAAPNVFRTAWPPRIAATGRAQFGQYMPPLILTPTVVSIAVCGEEVNDGGARLS